MIGNQRILVYKSAVISAFMLTLCSAIVGGDYLDYPHTDSYLSLKRLVLCDEKICNEKNIPNTYWLKLWNAKKFCKFFDYNKNAPHDDKAYKNIMTNRKKKLQKTYFHYKQFEVNQEHYKEQYAYLTQTTGLTKDVLDSYKQLHDFYKQLQNWGIIKEDAVWDASTLKILMPQLSVYHLFNTVLPEDSQTFGVRNLIIDQLKDTNAIFLYTSTTLTRYPINWVRMPNNFKIYNYNLLLKSPDTEDINSEWRCVIDIKNDRAIASSTIGPTKAGNYVLSFVPKQHLYITYLPTKQKMNIMRRLIDYTIADVVKLDPISGIIVYKQKDKCFYLRPTCDLQDQCITNPNLIQLILSYYARHLKKLRLSNK